MESFTLIPTQLRRLNSLLYTVKVSADGQNELTDSLFHIYLEIEELVKKLEDYDLLLRKNRKQ